jgi:hypothetical protein
MKTRIVLAVLSAIALSGCAAPTFKERLKPFVGQPANELMAKLGLPTRQDQIAGKKVCVRSKSGASDGTTYPCTIRATLGDKDIIENIDWSGNEDPCEDYAMKLMSAADERRNLR